MADERATNGKDVDPMAAFQQVRDAYLDNWAKATVDAVNSDAYAKASGTMLDAYLTVSSPFRENLEKAMLQALHQLSMPSRADFLSLAERLANLEMKIDDMDAKLDQIQTLCEKPSAAAGGRRSAPTARGNARTKTRGKRREAR